MRIENQWVSGIEKKKLRNNFMITIYTDGSSRGNPGKGGWGAIIICNDEISNSQFPISKIKEIGGREEKTTNNRMEMMAAIEALNYVQKNFTDNEIEIYADSEYVIKGITIWIKNWQKNNWRTKDKREVLNKDLWQKLLEATEAKNIEWKKVAGHSGHEQNERCDEIATGFADGLDIELRHQ
jgi:ribonuclease HI